METVKILNCTDHDVTLLDEYGNPIKVFKSSGIVSRLNTEIIEVAKLDDIIFTKTIFGNPVNLPHKQKDTILIVSYILKSSLPDREDLVSPSRIVRGYNGEVLGCKSLGI